MRIQSGILAALLSAALPSAALRAQAQASAHQATSLLGTPLHTPEMSAETRLRLQRDLDAARAEHAANPRDPDALIWVGRRHGYLGEYTEAVRVFTDGIQRFPRDARMYRHRGHRYITLRRLDEAIADFDKAVTLMAGVPDQVEPDGQPNPRNIPIGSLQSNVWYHLALAHYLKGDWDSAARAARSGIAVSSNADRLVSQTHWLYMALRRAGRDREAAEALRPVRDDFDIIENESYYRLVKLYRTGVPVALLDSVMAAGAGTPSDASLAYGLANWFLYTGDTARAVRSFERIIQSSQWGSFGVIAAEADLARLRRGR